MKYFNEIFFLIGSYKAKLPFLLGLFLLTTLLDVLGIGLIVPLMTMLSDEGFKPNFFNYDLSSIIYFKNGENVFYLIISIFFFLILMKLVLSILLHFIITRFSNELMVCHRVKLMKSYQSMSYEKYILRNSSEYINAINNLTALFAGKVLITSLKASSDIIITIGIIFTLFFINPYELLILILILISTFLIYDNILRNKMKNYGELSNNSSAAMLKALNEGTHGHKEIKILGKQNFFLEKVKNFAKTYSTNQTKYQVISIVPRYLFEFMILTFVLTLVVYHHYFIGNFTSLLPVIGSFGFASMRLLPASNSIAGAITSLRYNRHTVARLYSDLKYANPHKESVNISKSPNEKVFSSIEFVDVAYKYPHREQNALNSVSFKIRQGESIGIVGESGSGKTTLIDLLLGLLTPNAGIIKFNGEPIEEVLDGWRQRLAYLPQETFILDDTLSNNITLDNENEIQKSTLESILASTDLKDLFETLPEGVITKLGEQGVLLSGGQRQRVALSRAFYHDRDVLILDESTSAMDQKTENKLISEINKLRNKKTLIIIAHRHSTLKNCDRIFHMQSGKIVKVGTYKDLIEH